MSKYFFSYVVIILNIIFRSSISYGTSLDGTNGSSLFRPYHHVLYDGDYAKGFVYFANGFTVLADAQATMDCVTSVSGNIDLRGTGKLFLARNLALDSNITFSDSGYLVSKGMGLILHGDTTIPNGKTLHCTGDVVINGKGNTLLFEPHAQLLVDAHSTLTLRNMIIRTNQYALGESALNTFSSSSTLCLDNVILNLGDDLYLNNGHFFFHNDVKATGTSMLIYTSPASSYIASGSSLSLDQGITFSYAPTNSRRDLITLQDTSSSFNVQNCTLKTTLTSMLLTKGRIYFDKEVTVNSQASLLFGDGITTANDCLVTQAPGSIIHIVNGEIRITPGGMSLPSEYPYNVVSGGMWTLKSDEAMHYGPGYYVDSSLVYKNAQTLADGFSYQGLIDYADGFSLAAGEQATIGLLQPVGGNIDLNDTGILTLSDNLILDAHAQFINGGTISADDKTIVLQGDITLPFEKIITCNGGIIIDGNGKTLHVQPHAQLLVDANSTLTLRNMTIISERMGDSTPALWCNATGKLCFDNVILNMSEDLPINQGKVFIHNDVIVSGTHALMYQSPHVFTIGPASALYFDQDTTFSFSPQSDALERLHFADSSSRIMFDGAYFISTGNDLQLLQGRIFFDGLSHLEHYGAVYQGGNWVAATDKVCMFGDGVHAALDCNISLLPGARLIIKGDIVYNSAL